MTDASDRAKASLQERIEAVLAQLRPAVMSDGGDVEFVDVSEDGVVSIRLHGACIGCPSSDVTLTMGIERNLKAQVPEISRVQCV